MRFRIGLLPFLMFLILCSTTAGVFAIWQFAGDHVSDANHEINIGIGEFKWEGSDILPDDDTVGEDHVWLIANLVSGKTASGKEIGLNNANSDLNDYINDRLKGGLGWKRDYFGSMAVTGDEEMEELFGAAARGLAFIIQVESDNVYYIYTTNVYLGERGEPNWLGTSNKTPGKPTYSIGTYIEVIYRTKIERTAKSQPFDIIETKAGKAKSDWYDENRISANVTQIPAFDVNTWEEIA